MRGIADIGFNHTASGPSGSWGAGAGFATMIDGSSGCTTTTNGDCMITTCSGTPGLGQLVGAGAVSLDAPARSVPLMQLRGFYMANGDGRIAEPGQTVTARGTGDVSPPFELSIVTPARIDVTAPAIPPFPGMLAIDRAAALSVAWTSGAADDVVVAIAQAERGVILNCAFAAASGSGTIPASALAALAPGYATFGVESRTRVTKNISDWAFQLTAGEEARPASGGSFGLTEIR